ncbi:MAG TPA: hypothetical protein VK742_01195 [Candidatus Sulfotelmatobacter sp.]|nr:hypothetical protein [Candidatus Sulfotelmatobacter sp.]
MKNYMLNLLQQCSEENFGQEVVEHAVVSNLLKLTYNLETDLHTIFDQRSICCDARPRNPKEELKDHTGICGCCGKETAFEQNYDRYIKAYRTRCNANEALLADVYAHSGLLEEILRPLPTVIERELVTK